MEIEVQRSPSTEAGTFGKVYVDGLYVCESLEDEVREVEGEPVEKWKIKGDTAIPLGRYRVIINHSQRFSRELPLLLKVPGFEGIRIHPGNTHENTEGCLLVGTEKTDVALINSRLAFNELFADIRDELVRGHEVWIQIS